MTAPIATPEPATSRSRVRSPFVEGRLSYLRAGTVRPFNYMYEPPKGQPWHNCEYDQRAVRIADARHARTALSIDNEGFELRSAPTRVKDFEDPTEVAEIYYAEVAALALRVTGGVSAHVFDHQVRKREPGRPPLTFGRQGDGTRPAAVGRVHNDYTEESGRRRLALVLQDGAAVARVRRFSIVNVWRSIRGPVLDTPLAVCDARSVSPNDLVAAEVRYPGRVGEIYLATHSPYHAWSYFDCMGRDEALVLKQFDSDPEIPARFTPHAAFDHPHAPPQAPLRESIEVRCLVVYD